MTNCEAMTSPTHSFEYSWGLVKKCFPEKIEISKCHNFLISYPIFIIFAPICRDIFTLSFEIMVILDWTSPLKALFNNIFALKNLTCMSLHAISVFNMAYKWSPEKIHLKSIIKCFKEVKIDKWPDFSYSFLPIDCCVRINGEPDRVFSGDVQS